ncbi:MAG TPA: hypothetical protein VKF62_14550 [Planctomycetota bacterium]|nr:hypothetical protein [Planctomycetota bacterium]
MFPRASNGGYVVPRWFLAMIGALSFGPPTGVYVLGSRMEDRLEERIERRHAELKAELAELRTALLPPRAVR